MATYVALNDDPYSKRSEGRGFAYAGLVAGGVGLTGWAAVRGYLPGLRPADAFDQLLIAAMAWVGCGLFVLMAICAWVVIGQSRRLRGAVTVDDAGVLRELGKQRWMLRWDEIDGIVTMNQEGATLIPRAGGRPIEIPASLDDLGACIGEIKARGIVSLPSDRLHLEDRRPRRKRSSWQWALLLAYVCAFTVWISPETHLSHTGRIANLCAWMALFLWCLVDDSRREGQRKLAWFGLACFAVWLGGAVYHLAHTW